MDQKTLLIFAKRILSSSTNLKAETVLRQLQALLQEQGASQREIALLEKMIQSVPEMRQMADKKVLTEADVIVAERRAMERKRREADAMRHGRC